MRALPRRVSRSAARAALLSACAALVLLSGGVRAAGANGLRYEGSLTYTRGEYLFDRVVTGGTLTTGLAMQRARWSARLSLPLHLQSSLVTTTGAGTLPGGGPLQGDVAAMGRGGRPSPGAPSSHRVVVPESVADERRLVVGDPVLYVTVTPLAAGRVTVTVNAAAKAPLASERDYGTGKWDAGGGAGILFAAGRGWMAGADVSWWRLGDLDSLALRDPVSGTATLARSLGRDVMGALVVTAGTSAIDGYDGPVTAGLFFSRARDGRSISAGVTIGFTEIAPDALVSLSWGVPLAKR